MIARGPQDAGSDLWVLLAVAYASGDGPGAERSTVRLLSGLIHPERPSDARLDEALGRLEAAGLVRGQGGRYLVAGAVAAFLRARTHRRGVGHDHRDLIRTLGVGTGGGSRP